jgi:hypothetical protein
MGYMFRLLIESSSGPQDIDTDITALWDTQRLQKNMYMLYKHKNINAYFIYTCVRAS